MKIIVGNLHIGRIGLTMVQRRHLQLSSVLKRVYVDLKGSRLKVESDY